MTPLIETILEHVDPPDVDLDGPLQMQISSLDYSSYVGIIGIARIKRGSVSTNQQVKVVASDGTQRSGKVMQVLGFNGLERNEIKQANALPALTVDEPTISMSFQANSSPFAGKEGKYVTSRNIWDRLQQELLHNVALRVEQTEQSETYRVSGRGELHLSVLIENMRREGYEVAVGRPVVITRTNDGIIEEPYERITIDIEEQHQGAVMERMGERRGDLKDMVPDGKGTEFLTTTSGTGLIYSVFEHYGPQIDVKIGQRRNGVLISNAQGKSSGFALFNLQERGRLSQLPESQTTHQHPRRRH